MILSFIAAAIAAQGLDAPLIQARPTVRSEIRRGMDAAWDCHPKASVVDAMRSYGGCVEGVQSRNRQQMRTAFEAFDLGLYRVARDEEANAVSVIRDHPSPLFHLKLAQGQLDVEEAGYQQSRKALGLSEQQVDRVVLAKP